MALLMEFDLFVETEEVNALFVRLGGAPGLDANGATRTPAGDSAADSAVQFGAPSAMATTSVSVSRRFGKPRWEEAGSNGVMAARVLLDGAASLGVEA
jgi:hypothetical protein